MGRRQWTPQMTYFFVHRAENDASSRKCFVNLVQIGGFKCFARHGLQFQSLCDAALALNLHRLVGLVSHFFGGMYSHLFPLDICATPPFWEIYATFFCF